MQIGTYICQQPAILAALPGVLAQPLAALPALARTPERIVLLGTGSSMNALLAGADALEAATGAAIVAKEPEAFLRRPPRPNASATLVLAASQSGMSITSIEAVRLAVALGFPTVVITADGDSPIAKAGADTVLIPIGPETVGPKTKGYTATVLAVLSVAARLGGRPLDLSGLAAALERTVETGRLAADELLQRVGVPDYILVAGQAGHVGTALEASLKIAEISGVPTAAFDTEEALHGHCYGTTPNSLVIVIAQTADEAGVAANLGEALTPLGPRLAVCNLSGHATRFDWTVAWPEGAGPEELEWLGPAWAPVPFQWLGCALATARGLNPDTMIYPDIGKKLNVRLRSTVA
ncbi:fructoselysine-6-P-deglycase FrlB-like protein [Inquilinus ginsengisoli]|uniref:Glutamine--fructose-6-phosphate aminotransferase [isomerizing] n=1 Tax=Inquilinus ginsengisoli TaxID=363840 RepID=A0ABU1JPC0_9PROT|nr:SIS domain-containing protein [Inquilinus ginsengisoli]MDR6290466.1 fructoselysine-6-P-deglycase FrlB-like protein [Inquilinus ginsengisoli]